jgi:serine/threonine-protein kinase
MRRALLIAVIVLLGADSADARHRHSSYRYWGRAPSDAATATPNPGTTLTRRSGRSYARVRGEFPPADWQLQAPDPNWKGRRYVSPAGDAWVALYASPADQEGKSAHLKEVAFVDGEDVLTILGDRTGVLVTGTKGERMFVRKARLACGGRQWHHVALEFPVAAQRSYQGMVAEAARIVDLAEDDGCSTPLAGTER